MSTNGETIDVLLVDDDDAVAEVTMMHLERQNEGFDVSVELGAEAALDALDERVDCVVSDYEMPGTDGLDLLREVREYDTTLPFILFTGRGSEEIASEAISAGVTDYLQKGTNVDQYAVLANRIENAVAHRRSVVTAEETESRYRSLVENSPHAFLVHDGDRIHHVNERLATLVGADDPSDLVGADPLSFVHPEDRDRVAGRVDRIFDEDGSSGWYEFRLCTLDDEVRRAETRAALVRYDGARASQVVLRDVTDRYRRERRLEALHVATRDLLTAEDRQTVGEITVAVLANVFDEPVTAVWEYHPDRNALTALASSENAKRVAVESGLEPGRSPLPDWTVEMDVFESGSPRVVDDYGERDDVVTDAFPSAFLYPLERHGVLSIASLDDRSFDGTDRDLIGILARTVVATLDRLADSPT